MPVLIFFPNNQNNLIRKPQKCLDNRPKFFSEISLNASRMNKFQLSSNLEAEPIHFRVSKRAHR